MELQVIDLKPLIDGVIFPLVEAVLVPVGAALGSWAVYKVGQLAHINMNAKLSAQVEVGIQNAISFGLARAQEFADQHGTVQTKDVVVAQAANYLIPKMPKALDKLGITPKGLSERIEARLGTQSAIVPSGAA